MQPPPMIIATLAAALGIALRLGKPLYQVDYSAVISKYLGDTAKHIKAAFAAARDQDAVLFLMKLTAFFPSAYPPANPGSPASTRTATA
jgi:SpoVK/Ycf46/Vps4 family AAA+-type ATPase